MSLTRFAQARAGCRHRLPTPFAADSLAGASGLWVHLTVPYAGHKIADEERAANYHQGAGTGPKADGVLDMRFLIRYRRSIRLGRDYALVAAALAGLLATTVGVPKIEREHKDHSQSFPCQGGACGCASAEACWRSCCCTTPHQRLAWAAAHNVRPPDELVAEAQRSAPEDIASTRTCADEQTTLPLRHHRSALLRPAKSAATKITTASPAATPQTNTVTIPRRRGTLAFAWAGSLDRLSIVAVGFIHRPRERSWRCLHQRP